MQYKRNRIFSATLLLLGGMIFTSEACLSPAFSQSVTSGNTVAEAVVNIAELQASAAKGDAEAQLYLGLRYSMGEGVQKDDKLALKWIQLSAKQKNFQAQYILSVWCMNGIVVTKNEEMGLKLLISAANGGFAEAQFEYASYLAEQDKMTEALPWMKKAVEQGYVPALTALGAYYVATAKKDSDEMEMGMSYLTLAATEGDVEAQTALGATFIEQENFSTGIIWLEVAAMNGDAEVAASVKDVTATPEEYLEVATTFYMGDGIIPKNYEKCKFWAEKAAEENNVAAQFLLGTYYVMGINHELDLAKGVAYLEKAVAQNHAEAMTLLGLCYRNGRGVTTDTKKAIALFQKAAKLNDPAAYTQLAYSSLFGIGLVSKEETTRKLLEKAVALKHQNAIILLDYCTKNTLALDNGSALLKQIAVAAKSGDATAQYLMGEFFSDGCGVKVDEKSMLAYYLQSAKQNYAPALMVLSWAYEMGTFVKENRDTAIQLALRAAQQNDTDALTYLNTVGQVELAEDSQSKLP